MALPLRPRERRTLENLLETPGLSGEFMGQIVGGVEQSALDRAAWQREKRSGLQSLLPEIADFALNAASSNVPGTLVRDAYSGYRSPMVQGALDRLLGALYPAGEGMVSPFAAPAEAPDLMNAPSDLTDPLSGFDMSAFAANIRGAIAQGISPDEVRRRILGSPNAARYLQYQPYLDQVIDQLYGAAVAPHPSGVWHPPFHP